jgi:hypothetical protein
MEKYSYSKLETFDQCPYKYKFKYVDDNRSEESTLALEIGGLAHKGKELWGEYLANKKEPDFNYIDYVIKNGIIVEDTLIVNGVEVENKISEDILGIDGLKGKYFESYIRKCDKTGMDYDEKMKVYLHILHNETLKDWQILSVEENFKFIFEDRCVLHGFIDRVDINSNGDIRVVDYKTSKALYPDEKIKTPLQMVIYSLACENIYKKLPVAHVYDFIFLGEEQLSCSKGYLERGKKKLHSLLDKIEACEQSGEYAPKPSPLCHWCSYSGNTCAIDKKCNGMCEYYSLWTRENKNFEVNKKYEGVANTIKKEFIW